MDNRPNLKSLSKNKSSSQGEELNNGHRFSKKKSKKNPNQNKLKNPKQSKKEGVDKFFSKDFASRAFKGYFVQIYSFFTIHILLGD